MAVRRDSIGRPVLSQTKSARWSRERRAENFFLGVCINGKAKATHGVLCLRCRLVHRHGKAKAVTMSDYMTAPVCAEGKVFGFVKRRR